MKTKEELFDKLQETLTGLVAGLKAGKCPDNALFELCNTAYEIDAHAKQEMSGGQVLETDELPHTCFLLYALMKGLEKQVYELAEPIDDAKSAYIRECNIMMTLDTISEYLADLAEPIKKLGARVKRKLGEVEKQRHKRVTEK